MWKPYWQEAVASQARGRVFRWRTGHPSCALNSAVSYAKTASNHVRLLLPSFQAVPRRSISFGDCNDVMAHDSKERLTRSPIPDSD